MIGGLRSRGHGWTAHLRAGLLWTAAFCGAAAIVNEAALPAPLSLTALAALVIGLRELALAARGRRDARVADDVARSLRKRLPPEYVVITQYRPRDSADQEVALVVIGPHGVTVVEPRRESGELVCYQDQWYRRDGSGATHRIADSPSRRARWNATRVRGDLQAGGFVRTPVEALVVLTAGHLSDCVSSSVPASEGVDGAVAQLTRAVPRAEASPQRLRALTETLAPVA